MRTSRILFIFLHIKYKNLQKLRERTGTGITRSICNYPKNIGRSVYFVKIQGIVKGHANGVTQGFSASGVYRIGLLENWRNSSVTFSFQNLDQERS